MNSSNGNNNVNVRKDIRFRVYVAFTCICLFGVAVLLKMAKIQIKEGDQLRTESNQMTLRTDTLIAERGNIYSEDGMLLCSTIPQFDAFIDFSVIKRDTFNKYRDSLALCISNLFKDGSPADYRHKLEAGSRGKSWKYFTLKRNIRYYDYQVLRTFPLFRLKAKVLRIEEKNKRVNPYGMLAYRTLGLWRPGVWRDKKFIKNIVGLEARYDSVLSGTNGYRITERETGGVMVPIEGGQADPQSGKDIVTTLDFGIQDVAEHALKSVLEQYECLYGTCIVMEVETGKIRALVNLGRQKDGRYWEDFNYALIPTEPGSTFKLVTLLSLLNDGYINVNDMVDAEGGAIRFGKRVMRDSHLGLGVLSIKEAFAHSSNAAMAKLGSQYYSKDPRKFIKHLTALHLNQRTGIDLSGERKTKIIYPDSSDWSGTTLPWMATGYGILVTPLHTCMLYNAVANGGKLMRPYLVESIREYGKAVKTFEPHVIEEQIGSPKTIQQLRECMEQVVISGTATHIKSPYYGIAGKTGTAQVADKGIKYTDGVYQGSFVGYFPTDKPRYTIAVVIRTKPHSGAYYGGTIAAPVFRMISDKIFANGLNGAWAGPLDSFKRIDDQKLWMKQVMGYDLEKMVGHLDKKLAGGVKGRTVSVLAADTVKKVASSQVKVNQEYQTGIEVPNVKGMGLKDAVYLLEKRGFQVNVNGFGMVKFQSVEPGAIIPKGEIIVLQLS